MPIFWKSKILLAKIENDYGVDADPAGAADAIAAIDVRLNPMEGQDVDREWDLPYMGNSGTLPADLHMTLAFRIELEPSGTAGTPPAWGPLLRACGCAQTVVATTSVTYNPISSDQESATFYFYLGSTLFAMVGSRGSASFRIAASGIPMMEFEFRGLFTVAAEDTRPTPTLTGFKDPRVASKANTPTFTIDGSARVLRSLTLNMGNDVQGRFLIGSESIEIVDKAETLEATIEAVPVTSLNPWALAAAATPVPVVIAHGTGAGRIATLNVPRAQVQRPTAPEGAQGIVEWPLRFSPRPNTGNDQWTLVLT